MRVISYSGRDDIATVFVADLGEGRMVEFLESVQPPIPRNEKWVLIVSTLIGCPVQCPMCDAGGFYRGKLSREEILEQIDFLIRRRYPDFRVPAVKFKIQFARMGEPSFNDAVLSVLEELPGRYRAAGLMPCLSTVAPISSDRFFEDLITIKNKLYRGRFQLQFSIHSTDEKARDYMVPVKKWSFNRIAAYGHRFYREGDRKITLNFALTENLPIDTAILGKYFDPDIFFIKITPLNPTYRAKENGLCSYIDPNRNDENYDLVKSLRAGGYEVLVSVGEIAENEIGSNCGQYIMRHLESKVPIDAGYSCQVREYTGS